MPVWTDLKAWSAACWKTSWKVDPLPLSVPERLVDEDPLLDEEDGGVLDDEHAARSRAMAPTATAVAACGLLRRRCIAVLLMCLYGL
jgi:hypothetical protein